MTTNEKRMSSLIVVPHRASTKVQCLDALVPRVVFPLPVWACQNALVEASTPGELSWIGRVSSGRDDRGPFYRVDELALLRQSSSPGRTVLDPDAIGAAVSAWRQRARAAGEEHGKNDFRYWAHVHCGSSASPSARDDRQMEELIDPRQDGRATPAFFIRAVFSREPSSGSAARSAHVSVYEYHKGIAFLDVPWEIEDSVWRDELSARIAVVVRDLMKSPPGGAERVSEVCPSGSAQVRPPFGVGYQTVASSPGVWGGPGGHPAMDPPPAHAAEGERVIEPLVSSDAGQGRSVPLLSITDVEAEERHARAMEEESSSYKGGPTYYDVFDYFPGYGD